MKKERLDIILVDRHLAETREKAKSTIMAGCVYVNGNREDKPGAKFLFDVEVCVKGNTNPYVSRGGFKLKKAVDEFGICLEDKVAIDVGASTGGFTDCMLQNGAKSVLAIDVGYGQLAWKLRNNQRVRVMERTNVRYVEQESIGFLADVITIDVSFISLKKILPVVKGFLKGDGEIVCLIKPQFEAGREQVGKNGVVRDLKVHKEVIENIIESSKTNGFYVSGLTYSPIRGPEGNVEYLLHLINSNTELQVDNMNIVSEVIEMANLNLVIKRKAKASE